MDPSTSQIIPCRVRTDRHKEPRDTTQQRQDTPQGDPSLDFRVGLALVPPPSRSRWEHGALTAFGRCCPST